MRNSLLVLFLCVLFVVAAQAQELSKNKFEIIEDEYTSFVFENKIENFSFVKIETEQGNFAHIVLGDAFFYAGKPGMPEFPVMNQIIEIPEGATPVIEILEEKWSEYTLSDYTNAKYLYPAQPSYSKEIQNPPFVFDQNSYTSNSYLHAATVELLDLGMLRAVRLGKLVVSPLQYNPVSGEFKVLKYIKARIRFQRPDIKRTINEKLRTRSPYHRFVEKNVATKSTAFAFFNTAQNMPVKYVIVTDRMFEATLQPFIKWKTQKGFEVITAYTDQPEVGTTTQSIKSYLQKLYQSATPDNPAPVFLLLVGDTPQIPAFYTSSFYSGFSGHYTDLYYAEYTGDFYPELFYGRFSARDTVQLGNIIAKTLEYEKYQMPSANYLDDMLLVAGTEQQDIAPTATNGVVDYVKNTYLAPQSNWNTQTFYNPESINKAPEILTQLSTGKSLVLYTGHCDKNGWGKPNIKLAQVESITNTQKYFLSVNNCCSSGKFDEPECFAEALLRKSQSGAIGVIAASNETLWYEDFYWSVGAKKPLSLDAQYNANYLGAFDCFFHTHNEAQKQWSPTQGELVQAGNMAVTRSSSTFEKYYWETYNLLGDPSLMPFVGTATTMQLQLVSTIERGATLLTIGNAEPETYVCVSQNDTILGVAFATQEGDLQIMLQRPLLDMHDILVVASKQFSAPIIRNIPVKASEGVKICMSNYIFSDTLGNKLVNIANGQKVQLAIELTNTGNMAADSVGLKLSSINDVFAISESKFAWGNLDSNAALLKTNVFELQAKQGVANWQNAEFRLDINAANSYSTSATLNAQIIAPELEIASIAFAAKPVSGGSATATFTLKNTGNNKLDSIYFILQSSSENILPTSDSLRFIPQLLAGSETTVDFSLQFPSSFAPNDTLILNVKAQGGGYEAINSFPVSLQSIIFDFENGDMSEFAWGNKSYSPWYIESNKAKVYAGSYCIRSGKIDDLEQTTLSLPIEFTIPDTVRFALKVSSERDYDLLYFSLNSMMLGSWSGDVAWKEVAHLIPQGRHTLSWTYYKDGSDFAGEDAAWIDNIVLPAGMDINTLSYETHPVALPSRTIDVKLFPNPVKDVLTIRLNTTEKKPQMEIYDVFGNRKWTKNLADNSLQTQRDIEVNVLGWNAGIYFLIVRSQNQVQSCKFVVVK